MKNCDPIPQITCLDGTIVPNYLHNPIRKISTSLPPLIVPNSYSPSTTQIYTATTIKSFKHGSYERYLLKKLGDKYKCTHCK